MDQSDAMELTRAAGDLEEPSQTAAAVPGPVLDQSQHIPSSVVEDYLEEEGQVEDEGMELGELQDAHEESSPQATGAIRYAVQGGPGGRESQAGPKKREDQDAAEQPLDAVIGAGGQWNIPGGRETQGMVLGLPEQGYQRRDHRLRKPQRDSSSPSSGSNLLRNGSDVANLDSTCTLIYSHRLRSPHIILIYYAYDHAVVHTCAVVGIMMSLPRTE